MRYAHVSAFILALMASFLFSIGEASAQGVAFLDYKEWSLKWSEDDADGEFVLLISADWCEPCGRLKEKLRAEEFRGLDVGILDVDGRPKESQEELRKFNRKSIPTLIKYIRKDGKWKSRVWNGVDLRSFMTKESDEHEKALRLLNACSHALILALSLVVAWPRD